MKNASGHLLTKITAEDVAKAAGCSKSTVSKVLNNHHGISEYLRSRVLEEAQKLNYRLKRGKLRRVAIILPTPWKFLVGNYVATMLNAMVYVLYQRDIRAEIIQENDLKMLRSEVIDGAISITVNPDLTANWFEYFQLPLVRINANPALGGKDNLLAYVNMDGEKSMKVLLDKFYKLGHRRIFLLTPDSIEVEQLRTRYQGFFNYLRSRHIQHPEKNCIFNMRTNSFEENFNLLKQAVSDGATALIAVDEGEARNVLTLIEKLKLNIPKRISVVSWEQKNILPYFDPPISGMAMDYTLLSEKAVDLLAALCRGENVSDVSFPFTLIDRGSIAPVYQRNTQQKLAERILETLKNGAATRVQIATMLNIKPYCGYFNRTILDLLNSKQIVYGEKTDSGRIRLLQLK